MPSRGSGSKDDRVTNVPPPRGSRAVGSTKASSTVETRRKPREERWPELLEVAANVFYERGYSAASLREIADRLGIMKGSLYYYFTSKEDLLFSLLDTVHRDGIANVSRIAGGNADPLQKLSLVIYGHVSFIANNFVRTAVFLHEMNALPVERQRQILGGDRTYSKIFRSLIDEAQKGGLVDESLDTRLTGDILLNSLNSIYRWLEPRGAPQVHAIGRHFSDILVHGIANEAGRKAYKFAAP